MHFESLQRDLQQWLKESIDKGCSADVIARSMRTAGYEAKFARRAIDLAFERFAPRGPGRGATSDAAARGVGAAAAETDSGGVAVAERPADGAAAVATADDGATPTHSSQILARSPNAIPAGDRAVPILLALNEPRIVLFEGLLSAEECDELVTLSRGKLSRSSVVNADTGAYDVHPDRTSEGTHFQRGENALVRRIEARIAELIGCPVEHGEPIQVLYYRPGAEYKPHFDYFDPALPGNDKVLEMGGQRIATIVMYLNDVEAGGSTVFPEVGLDVLPRKGNAVYFAYCGEDGQLDRRTLHGGSPVAAGEKWIATKWLRQRDYSGPSA